jgi:hypothetical protein
MKKILLTFCSVGLLLIICAVGYVCYALEMIPTTVTLLRTVTFSLIGCTFLVCIVKWRKTKDVGFLFLCLCLVVIPFLWSIFDFYLRSSALQAIRTGEGNFLFLRMTRHLEPGVGIVEKGTLDPTSVIEYLNWAKWVGTELIKLFIILMICRITVHYGKKPSIEP